LEPFGLNQSHVIGSGTATKGVEITSGANMKVMVVVLTAYG